MDQITQTHLIPISIEEEMKNSFLEYSMSVIVSRALPDVRDGLKPVHRRILYAMYAMGNHHNKAYKKSARTVGEVIAKYHPHGDSAVYDALARMAQDFSLRYPLIDGQGNFGSVDGDSPAAMRYTEARLARISAELLNDLDKETVDFVSNYDESEREPTVLPAKLPNLFINGSGGIAVGMATNIPPHNLAEIVDGLVHLIDNPDCSIDDLMRYIPGPDFPTGAEIHGASGIRSAYHTGRGLVVMRATAEIEPMPKGDRERIVVSEIPYQVNKARLIEKIADLVRDKKIVGISDIRDESDRKGMRIVVELRRDAIGQVILNQLYKHTQMQDTFGVILIALTHGRPKQLTLKEGLSHFIAHRREVITRRTLYELGKAMARAHILEGYVKALDHLDELIELIRASESPDSAKVQMMGRYAFSELQAKAVLEMRLQRLTGMERAKIENELTEVRGAIEHLEFIRDNESEKLDIIKTDLLEIKETFGNERRTRLIASESDVDIEDLIPDDDMVVTISTAGYIKRNPLAEYRAQKRGGRGVQGIRMKEEDVVQKLFVASNHTPLLFFTTSGRVFRKKVYEIPEAGKTAKGKAVVNLMQLQPDEKIATVFPLLSQEENDYLVIATQRGQIKKTAMSGYRHIHATGIKAIELAQGDAVIAARITDGERKIILSSRKGMSICFAESDIRPMGRVSMGVRGIRLSEGDEVIGMMEFDQKSATTDILFSLKENGYGKMTEAAKYPLQGRSGKGVIDIKTDDGDVVSALKVTSSDELMIISRDGVVIRIKARSVSVIGRNTKGVRVINLDNGDKVVSAGRFEQEPEEEAMATPEGEEGEPTTEENAPESEPS